MDAEPLNLSDIDTTRALRTVDELARLVAAIHGSRPETQETNWLEWKSSLDLNTAAGKFAVAKAVLGFANRPVEQAQLACEGVAYMAVGVQPEIAAGVAVVDHAALSQGIKTYTTGTRWTPFFIPFEGVSVLVVVVEAPRHGDRIHTLQKTYSNGKKSYDKGTVFHRGAAQSEPAGPDDVEMLSKRLLQGAQRPQLNLTLTATADPLIRLSVGREEVENWLSRREEHIRKNSGKPPERPAPPPTPARPPAFSAFPPLDFGGMNFANLYANPKDNAEFERRVTTYLSQMQGCLKRNVVREIVKDDNLNTVHLVVSNDTDDPMRGVQLTVRVPKGACSSIRHLLPRSRYLFSRSGRSPWMT